MDFSHETIALLEYLLPGFLAAWIFYGFTSYPKPSQFERVVQALIFTLLIQVVGNFLLNKWTGVPKIVVGVSISVIFGLVFSAFANNNWIHKLFRCIGITKETSFPSVWFGTISKKVEYVVLHFKDGRRLYGLPKEWPSEPNTGHIEMLKPSWIHEEGRDEEIPGVEKMLIDTKDVRWVEFMKKEERSNGKESNEYTTG